MFDNLSSHVSAVKLIQKAGHIVIWRPIHSPDSFAPVEVVFANIGKYLQHHDATIDDKNLKAALVAALDHVTPELVKSLMIHCHFYFIGRHTTPTLVSNDSP